MNTDLLFLSGIIPDKLENYFMSNSKVSVEFAADKYQKLLINGLKLCNNCSLTVLNSVFVGSFPHGFKKPFVSEFAGETNEQTTQFRFINTGFINLWGVRHLFKYQSLLPSVSDWLNNAEAGTHKAFIGYSVFSPTLDICKRIKKNDPSITTGIIVPDLPEFCYGKSNIYNRYLRHSHEKLMISKPYVDKYILFTHQMAEILQIPKEQFIVIEGICSSSDDGAHTICEKPAVDCSLSSTRKLLYTGSLMMKYGIGNLIEAFHNVENIDYQLELCGDGDAVPYIRKMSEVDTRILFSGRVSNVEAVWKQQEADVLVNPRQDNENYTKYSFPSKTMEYLLSGTPMIGYKLAGVPDEYDDYISYVDDYSSIGLEEKIRSLCSLSEKELKKIGEKSKQFVLTNKNETVQAKRLLEFINE